MPKVKQEHSNIARRAVLAGVCAAPFMGPAAIALAAARSGPAPEPDPVFAAIEAHKKTLAEFLAVVDEESDLDNAVLARCGRLRPAIAIPELPDGLGEVYSRGQIDVIVGRLFGGDADAGERVRQGLYERLDAAEREFAQVKAELGADALEARYEAANDAERIALDTLLETVPTTPAGLLAMLEHIGQRGVFGDGVIERWQAETLLATLTTAARNFAGEPTAV